MSKKSGFSLRPVTKTPEEEFIQSASNDPTPKVEGNELRPWDAPGVREDVLKMVSLRLQERYILQLQFLSEQTGRSQQEILRRLVVPYLEEEVKRY